jgi:Fe2+ transport system protein FeoA
VKATLADLEPGQGGEIAAIDCNRRMSRRLMEMGLLPGTAVRVVRIAPLGDPMELRLRHYSLSVRRSEATQISVEVEERT